MGLYSQQELNRLLQQQKQARALEQQFVEGARTGNAEVTFFGVFVLSMMFSVLWNILPQWHAFFLTIVAWGLRGWVALAFAFGIALLAFVDIGFALLAFAFVCGLALVMLG